MQFLKTILFFLFVMDISFAQTHELKLKSCEYDKWGKLDLSNISPSGKWVSYMMSYDTAPDTLFVQNTTSSKIYVFPDASNGKFSTDGQWFTALDPIRGLALLNLEENKLKWFPEVVQFDFYLPENVLLTRSKNGNASDLKIYNLKEDIFHEFPNVSEFKISTNGNICAIGSGKVILIVPKRNYQETLIIQDSVGKYKHPSFDKNGDNLAFLQELPKDKIQKNHKLYIYNIPKATIKCLDPNNSKELLGLRIAIPQKITPLFFFQNSDRIYFSRSKPDQSNYKSMLEIWDSESPVEYNQLNDQIDLQHIAKLTEWNLETNEVKFTASEELPSALLSSNRKYMLFYDRDKYEPQFQYTAPIDIYITNLANNKSKLLIAKHNLSGSNLIEAPTSKYIAFQKQNNWYIYDVKRGTYFNITKKITYSLINRNVQGGMPEPFGSPGWSEDGQYLFLYDQYDIWMYDVVKKRTSRITNGRNLKTKFRIAETFLKNSRLTVSVNFSRTVLSNPDGLIIEATSENMSSGLYVWSKGNGLKNIICGNFNIGRVRKAANSSSYIYTIQTSEMPPKLMTINLRNNTSKMLFQSNVHYEKYEWSKCELISYVAADLGNLNGILYYPPNFDSSKKYPMIVYVYETLSSELHQYHNPTLYNNSGFNPTNYALDGYLVLFPDIRYNVGSPGISALNCVLSAVNTVKQRGIVEENHIGLIGHSFGGYEVNYIITQTSTFAAAVSGASVSDMISSYFSIHFDTEHSNMWRYETQQYRMGKNAFEDYDNYIANSPIANAANINTPLLSWTGKKDNNVPWTQSIELHLALRRLQKKNLFLVYKDEQHTIEEPNSQMDLTTRIKNWFDSWLK